MKKGYFSKIIVDWYLVHRRPLPWRNTPDPYKIWLSEIILQQTRVAQGLPYYKKFIQHYPTVRSLAKANERDILRLWQGLGYYTRARNLRQCAREVVENFNGKFPATPDVLRRLPGIGDYTAAAIASIAFQVPAAVVDGNVYRVLSRVFGIRENIASGPGKKFFFEFANQLLPTSDPGIYNQAVMEFGALHCLPKNPRCVACIFRNDCFAFRHERQEELPVNIRQLKITRRHFYYFFFRNGNRILMKKRQGNDIWKGLFDFPYVEAKRRTDPAKIISACFPQVVSLKASGNLQVSKDYRHVLTHQIIQARFVEVEWLAGKTLPASLSYGTEQWYSIPQIEKLPKPVLISRYLSDRDVL